MACKRLFSVRLIFSFLTAVLLGQDCALPTPMEKEPQGTELLGQDAAVHSLQAEVNTLRYENKLLMERIEKLEANRGAESGFLQATKQKTEQKAVIPQGPILASDLNVSFFLENELSFLNNENATSFSSEMKRVSQFLNLWRIPQTFNSEFKNPCWVVETKSQQVHGRGKSDGIDPGLGQMGQIPDLHCLPYFFITGFEKTGSTWLYETLTRHPNILGSGKDGDAIVNKEPHWWARPFEYESANDTNIVTQYIEKTYGDAIRKIAEHHTDTGGGFTNLIFGDGSTSLFWEMIPRGPNTLPAVQRHTTTRRPFVPELVRYVLPNARYIVVFREPVARFVSAIGYFWNWHGSHHLGDGAELNADSFHQVAQKGIATFHQCMEETQAKFGTTSFFFYCGAARVPAYLEVMKGVYARHLLLWWRLMPVGNLLVLRSEDLRAPASAQRAVDAALRFLGVGGGGGGGQGGAPLLDLAALGPIKGNARPAGKRFRAHARTLGALGRLYAPYNRELAAMLGDDRFLWRPREE